jgi:hypothetical protein
MEGLQRNLIVLAIAKNRFVWLAPIDTDTGQITGRGRNAGFPAPPAQIPACAANAPGSSLGFWRQSGGQEADVVS